MAERTSPSLLALQLSCRGNVTRERIMHDWVAFLEARGELNLLQNLPKTAKGVSIDWVRLYEEVVAKGGFQYVSQHKLWSTITSKECMNLDLMPYKAALYYERYLRAFEEKQLFGRDLPPAITSAISVKRQADDAEQIATLNELQEAQSVGGTPLPHTTKRLKVHRRAHLDLGSMHGIVLALDSDIPSEVVKAINLLNVMSYGNPNDPESELFLDNAPGLLDAIYRQLQLCSLLPHQWMKDEIAGIETVTQRARRRLLNLSASDGQRELMDAKGLLLLNILRNLSMIGENEKPIADHEEICMFLILALRTFEHNFEIGDHVLDILCSISKRIDFFALHPPTHLEIWHPHYQLSSQLWKKEKVLPLECLLQQVNRMLLNPLQKRSVVMRCCELLCNVCRDVTLKSALSSSKALQDPELLDQIVFLLGCSRQDFWNLASKKKHDHSGGYPDDDDYDMDEDEDDFDEPELDENSKWPAPWESDGFPSGVGMGVVYVSPEGNRNADSSTTFDNNPKLDHEMRDAALEVLFRLSDCDDNAKLRLAKHPTCLTCIAASLTSCIGRPEAARIAVATLSNISMNRQTFPHFLPIEKDLILVACSDRSVSDILNNVVADVYGMHSL